MVGVDNRKEFQLLWDIYTQQYLHLMRTYIVRRVTVNNSRMHCYQQQQNVVLHNGHKIVAVSVTSSEVIDLSTPVDQAGYIFINMFEHGQKAYFPQR